MTSVQDIKEAIEHLPKNQFSEIHHWIVEKDWEEWDDQIERDSNAGKLDFLTQNTIESSGDNHKIHRIRATRSFSKFGFEVARTKGGFDGAFPFLE